MSSFTPAQTDDVSIATIRALAADVVAKANSGHPGKQNFKLSARRSISYSHLGAPMGMAAVAHILFTRYAHR